MISTRIVELREDYNNGMSLRELALKYCINKNSVLHYAKYADIDKIKLYEKQRNEYEKLVCEVASGCTNAREVLKVLGTQATNSAIKVVEGIIERNGIKFSSILLNESLLERQTKSKHNKSLEEIFSSNTEYNSSKLRNRLIKEGYKEPKCERCLNTHWYGQTIPLQLHHINGDHKDNRLENLQMLCPNCHAQTDSYCKGKHLSIEKKCICSICGKEFPYKHSASNKFCSRECYDLSRNSKKNIQFSKDEIEQLFLQYGGYKTIETALGLTDGSMKRIAKKLSLPSSGKEMRKYVIEKYGKQNHWRTFVNKENIGKSTPIIMFDKQGKLIKEYKSIKAIEEENPSLLVHGISRAISKNEGKYKDYIFVKNG